MAAPAPKLRSHHQSLPGPKSRKSAAKSSSHNTPDKPLPNYLKPTICSSGDPDNQKLLRRRSFDRPPSSLSSPRLQKSLNISPGRSLPVTPLRSASFHSTRSSPSRPPATAKSPPVAPRGSKKSHTKRQVFSSTKVPDSPTTQESPPEEEKELVKATTTHVQVADVEDDKEDLAADTVHPYQPTEEKETEETDASPALDSPIVAKAEAAGNEDKKSSADKDKREEQRETEVDQAKEEEDTALEDNHHNRAPDAGGICTDVPIDLQEEATSVRESIAEQEREGEIEKKEEQRAETDGNEEEANRTMTIAVSPEGPKRQVVQGKKESPSAYNDVIEKTASKLLENRKNKVKALVGAFETVIDYETAASK